MSNHQIPGRSSKLKPKDGNDAALNFSLLSYNNPMRPFVLLEDEATANKNPFRDGRLAKHCKDLLETDDPAKAVAKFRERLLGDSDLLKKKRNPNAYIGWAMCRLHQSILAKKIEKLPPVSVEQIEGQMKTIAKAKASGDKEAYQNAMNENPQGAYCLSFSGNSMRMPSPRNSRAIAHNLSAAMLKISGASNLEAIEHMNGIRKHPDGKKAIAAALQGIETFIDSDSEKRTGPRAHRDHVEDFLLSIEDKLSKGADVFPLFERRPAYTLAAIPPSEKAARLLSHPDVLHAAAKTGLLEEIAPLVNSKALLRPGGKSELPPLLTHAYQIGGVNSHLKHCQERSIDLSNLTVDDFRFLESFVDKTPKTYKKAHSRASGLKLLEALAVSSKGDTMASLSKDAFQTLFEELEPNGQANVAALALKRGYSNLLPKDLSFNARDLRHERLAKLLSNGGASLLVPQKDGLPFDPTMKVGANKVPMGFYANCHAESRAHLVSLGMNLDQDGMVSGKAIKHQVYNGRPDRYPASAKLTLSAADFKDTSQPVGSLHSIGSAYFAAGSSLGKAAASFLRSSYPGQHLVTLGEMIKKSRPNDTALNPTIQAAKELGKNLVEKQKRLKLALSQPLEKSKDPDLMAS